MGDIADWYLDSYLDEWEHFSDNQPLSVKCDYCGKERLHWRETEKGWRLFDRKGQMHSCRKPKQQTAEEMFPD